MGGLPIHDLFSTFPSVATLEKKLQSGQPVDITLKRQDSNGETDYEIDLSVERNGRGEIQAFVCTLRNLTQEIKDEQERIDASLRDPLTGLPGRTLLMNYLERAINEARRRGQSLAIVRVDIDRFSRVNEELSFAKGDMLLAQLGRSIAEQTGQHAVVARTGGAEFCVLLHPISDDSEVHSFTMQVSKLTDKPQKVGHQEVPISFSVGVAKLDDPGLDAGGLMRNAARAVQQVKSSGGNGIHLFTEGHQYQQHGKLALEIQIKQALERDEFVPFYQPIVDVQTGEIAGFEVLARWQHPELGLKGADYFIDFAESTGLIREITHNLQRRAFADLAALSKLPGLERLYFSLNVSDREFEDEHFIEKLMAQIKQAKVNCSQVYLELTERMVMINPGDQRLKKLSEAGFQLLIDDFGTGYSSLSRLHKLPLFAIKIDRQFVVEMRKTQRAERLVSGMINLANSLELNIIAEGCEEPEDAEKLQKFQCKFIQGYLFGRPAPFEEIKQGLINPTSGGGYAKAQTGIGSGKPLSGSGSLSLPTATTII